MQPTFRFDLDQGGTRGEDRLRQLFYLAFDLAMDSIGLIRSCAARSRQRRALLDLDGRLLADIGVSRHAAAREARKWSWQ